MATLPMFQNKQTPEKIVLNKDGVLEVVDIFYTIQGEGPFAGTPAVFVRLAGCNLQCPMCDTDYTTNRKSYTPANLYTEVLRTFLESNTHGDKIHPKIRRPLIVLTGGEPFRQYFGPFAQLCLGNFHKVQVETNGTLWNNDIPWSDPHFHIIVSPKTPTVNIEIARFAKVWKYVLQFGEVDEEDGLPTSVLDNDLTPARPWGPNAKEVYIQPADSGCEHLNKAHNEAAVRSCLKFGYKMSIQMHKILGLK